MARFSVILSLSIAWICACQTGPQAKTQLTTVDGAHGGKIVYGQSAGSASQTAVLINLLTRVHSLCGEKPQIGRVFQFKGTNSVGVFFTVTDHPERNMPLAGMVIAAATGPNQAEGAMIYDRASNFGTTVNPLLEQLSGLWHPGASSTAASSTVAAPVSRGQIVPAAALSRVTLPDSTASVGIPAGWRLDPGCAGGTISISGPHGEIIDLNIAPNGLDAANRFVQQEERNPASSGSLAKSIIYPYNVDLTKAFPDLFQFWRRIQGAGPANLQLSSVASIPASQGERCVQAKGHVIPDGKNTYEINTVLCTTPPAPTGLYGIAIFHTATPVAYADQERATVSAIMASFQLNKSLINQRVAAATGPVIAEMNKQVEAQAHQYIAYLDQIGTTTTNRIRAGEVANGEQQASWEAGEAANSQNVQGFTNYLLDQSVVQNNITGVQGTLWNNAANALVQSNPNKYSYVPNSNINLGSQY
jgi:hypothetical protein